MDAKKRVKQSILTLLILLLVLFAVVSWFPWNWDGERHADMVDRVYCTKYGQYDKNALPPPQACLETKRLRIPARYFVGRQKSLDLDSSREPYELKVAYPSMQPWADVPFLERWRDGSRMIEIEVRGIGGGKPMDSADVYLKLGKPADRPVKMPNQPYGLDFYEGKKYVTNSGTYLREEYYMPPEPDPRIFIGCSYNGVPADDARFGCFTRTYTPWHLHLEYRHKRILLPNWEEIHTKALALIESFVVQP